ncbi:bifunctional glutamate N-acetyltransferase/amino-acid acetyltransferase ArgJ [Entomobacter blattae]|uniref:Arginine biosynthesis bifunctional protein ArgJ n=1 Tax=Entomobacter blattae TaxID=2762277 RepID=A0A7H1NTE8_9PROT|nr:bifunctional glutamate N-acetyltransferase/amino-acid acetyltransferase ArgJ [Entomobacter blattae]QNT79058.1 Arginine biosynthesis bifunctional protein ArgJ [Entomobacter blattae]
MAQSLPVSPLAKPLPPLHAVPGVKLGAYEANIRYKNRLDLVMFQFESSTQVAGVFTKNLCPGAPIDWCRNALQVTGGTARALVVNAGNANVFTGQAGKITTQETAEAAAKLVGCRPEEILLASTGVIGEKLDSHKITTPLPHLFSHMTETKWEEAARGIMTTDTFAKASTRKTTINGSTVIIQGIAKGSGMIAPDMATMLCFIATNAAIPAPILQELLAENIQDTFNSITVDSDTSTSDTVLLFATGTAKNTPPFSSQSQELNHFKKALHEVLLDLALMVISDGEGAQKIFKVCVKGAQSDNSAKRIAQSIANSPLVKTAIAGEDANWGRVVMAVGKSGEPANRDTLSIMIGGIPVAINGVAVKNYDETPVVAHMKTPNILIEVDLGIGQGQSHMWSCDLTHGYIDINGSYRS